METSERTYWMPLQDVHTNVLKSKQTYCGI